MWRFAWVLPLPLAVGIACGGNSEDGDGSGGSGGSSQSGSGGSSQSGSGGSVSGAGGKGGSGQGGSAQGGSSQGGSSTGGSSSGGSGQAGSGQGGFGGGAGTGSIESSQCEVDQDCTVLNDCCSCRPVRADEAIEVCEVVCLQSACAARGLEGIGARCVANRCVFDIECSGEVSCDSMPPTCEDGEVPSRTDSCWGPCVAAPWCGSVESCDVCDASRGEVCVESGDSPILKTSCVSVDASCAENPTCECVDGCNQQCDVSDGKIGCYCIVC